MNPKLPIALLGPPLALLMWGAFAAGDPDCIYGKVLDGHSGKVRCLSPEEVAPPPAEAADAGVDASPSDAGYAAAPRRDASSDADALPQPVAASIEGIAFEGGEVPRAAAALGRLRKELARCASAERLAKGEGSIEMRFIVRAPGKAEGVDVGESHGVSPDIVRCARSVVAGRFIGAPSADPVGVSFSVRFKVQ